VRVLSPSELGQLLALPPMHTLLDLGIVFGGGSLRSSTVALGLAAFLLLVRAVLLAFLIALIHEVLTGEGAVNEGGYRSQFRTAAARMARSLPQLFLVEVAFLAILSFVGGLIQSLLGKLGLPVVLVVELYYLIFAPVIAVIEGRSVTDAFNLGLRVVRRSSRQSILFASGYSLLTLILLGVPAPFASASPSIQVWAYVLFMSFIHVAVLATVVLRWLAVRQEVLEGWTGPARRRSRFSLFGLFGATGERAPS
jgi:hypothetical protein